MKFKLKYKLECLMGFFGVVFSAFVLFLAVILTPGYNIFEDTVSSLGNGIAKSLFSIAFVIGGSSGIPFYIYLERELININDNVRRFATVISIVTCVCIALVGIIPDETYHELFIIFHNFVAFFSFIGSGLYIGLFSILMLISTRTEDFIGVYFHRLIAYLGFFTSGLVVVLFIVPIPIIEWTLTISILCWIMLTSIYLIRSRFINLSVVHFRQLEDTKKLELFEEILKALKKLNLEQEAITRVITENIEFLRERNEKNTN